MLKIYVPTSALTNSQWMYNGVTASGNWTNIPAGTVACYGGVVSADYRYDKNVVGVSGALGNRLSYTFVPFIIKNEFAAPHTYCYGVGYSDIYTSPSTQPTGSGFNMSNDAGKDASAGDSPFGAFTNEKFGVYFLGMGSGSTIWNLTNSLWVNSNGFQSASGRLTLPPNILIRAIKWHEENNISPAIAISRTDNTLGTYNRKTWNTVGVIDASGTVPPSGGQEIHLYRDNFIFGFMYFYCSDSSTTNEADTDYFTPTLVGGYPQNDHFQTTQHGRWIEPDLDGQLFETNKTVYWGSNVSIDTRECRIGLYFAGRRVN